MNNLTEKYLNAEYDEFMQLSENVSVVRGRRDGRLLVEKIIDAESAEIYRAVRDQDIHGIPDIYSITPYSENYVILYKYIEGLTIKEYVEANGAMKEDLVDKCISDICTTLTSLHRMGIVHRDITASNVIFGVDGRCYLIDLGISRVIKRGQSADTEVFGTAGFAPPEQFGFRQTDGRSDIYSVGVLMSYMLTGQMPGETTASEHLGSVISKCMAMDPDKRYNSAEELKAAVSSDGKAFGVFKYVLIILTLILLAVLLPEILFGNGSGTERLYYAVGYCLCLFVPLTVIGDFFGIIHRLAERFEWRLRERIGIRFFIIIMSVMLFTIINNFIQVV